MACCGTSATTGAVASTRSRQGPPPKLISSKSSKSLYGSQPFGDARSCEIFVEHAVAGFWHCASCGVPKCSHFNAKRCAAVPPPKDHAGPVYQRKGEQARRVVARPREATLVAGKLKLFEVAEGGGPGPHVATYVVDANAHVVVGDQSEGRRHALRIETASGARVRLACAAPEARDAWVAALVATQAWLVRVRAWRSEAAHGVFDGAYEAAGGERRRRAKLRDERTALDRRLRALMEDCEALAAAARSARAPGAIRDDGGAAGAAKRAGERLAARLETSTDRDLVKAFGKGVAGKACRSLMKLNEAATGAALAREPTLQQALSACDAERRGGAALTGADEIVAPTLLLADAALLSYGPANLDSLAPTNENAAAYATTVLLNLASAQRGQAPRTVRAARLSAELSACAQDALDALREACGAPTPSRRSAPSLREELTPKGGLFAREAPDAEEARRRRRAGAGERARAAAESDAPVAVVLRVDAPPPAEDGEDKAVAKYRKLLKMGMPRDGIATKMAAEGLDPALLGLEPPAALARERSTRAYPKPVAAPRATEKLKALWWEPLDQAAYANAQQAALSLRKIQDAGLGDAARVAAALRGERGADLGLDEDALELVRRVGLPPKAADDAGRSAAPPRPARRSATRTASTAGLRPLPRGPRRGRRARPPRRRPREARGRAARARANHGLAPDGKGEVRDLFDDGANLLGMLERRRVAIEGGDDDDFASDEGDDDWDD
ncbi:Nfx1-type zinc finger-containing protein [Aureococcus anophagefferens]|nr:Nfx1-type zinc finger-containing protein [Aureococcus anophagefferens]